MTCEGYRKDYKWRQFDEVNIPKPPPKPKKNHVRSHSFTPTAAQPRPIARVRTQIEDGLPSSSWSPGFALDLAEAQAAALPEASEDGPTTDEPPDSLTPGLGDLSPLELPEVPGLGDHYALHNSSRASFNDDFFDRSVGSRSPELSLPSLPGSSHGPRLRSQQSGHHSPTTFEELLNNDLPSPEQTMNPNDMQDARQPSPAHSDSSVRSTYSNQTLMRLPTADPRSPDMLFQRYDKQTCGIMSVKDGPNENPWRNLILPMAHNSIALRHAIYAMTAFHGRHDVPELGHAGLYHMQKTLRELSKGIQNIPLDARVATSIVLAFSHGWDRSVATGAQHLRGAKMMIADVIRIFQSDLEQGQLSIPDLHKWRFLCNTYVYMDVTSRLTNMEKSDSSIHRRHHHDREPNFRF